MPIVITSVVPSILRPGISCVLTGTGFGAVKGAGSVTLNGGAVRTAICPTTVWSDTSITFTVDYDDGAGADIAAFPDRVVVRVANDAADPPQDITALALEDADLHYHGEVVVGCHVAFAEGPKSYSNLPNEVIWTDLTRRVRGFSINRGRQHELGAVQAGTATIALSNNDGAFNEHNTASPYYPNVRPLVAIRLVAAWIPDGDLASADWEFFSLWSGYVESWPVSFPGHADSIVQVTCSDLFKGLARSVFSPTSWTQAVLAESPVAFWRMTDGATVDATGNGHTLTWSGGPAQNAAGKWSGDLAITLDGVNDFATSALEDDLELFSDMTIEFWFRPAIASVDEGIVGTYGSAGNSLWDVSFLGGGLHVGPMSAANDLIRVSPNLTVGLWYHVVVTIDWETVPSTSRVIKCYVNGELSGEAATDFHPAAATRTFRIGSYNTAEPASFFEGAISELVIYDKLLTPAEVSNHYASSFETLPPERTDLRVERILDLYVDGEAGLTVRSQGQSVVATRNPGGETLAEIQTSIATEGGLFFMGGNGLPVFEGRHYRLLNETAARATFGPTPPELPMHGFAPSFDDSSIYNFVRVNPNDETRRATVIGAVSVETYGARVLDITTYPEDTNEALSLATYVVANNQDPTTRIQSVAFNLGANSALWPVVLGGDLSQRFLMKKALIGDDFSQEVYIEAVSMQVSSKKTWAVTWQLSPTATTPYWVLGTTGSSELGVATRLGF